MVEVEVVELKMEVLVGPFVGALTLASWGYIHIYTHKHDSSLVLCVPHVDKPLAASIRCWGTSRNTLKVLDMLVFVLLQRQLPVFFLLFFW